MADIYLTNSLTRKKEKFEPINPPKVGIYTCGMTVYNYAHIGHGRKYVMDDVLRRTLKLNGFTVKHVQNVTDVGHLTSDEDAGEDKMEKGAKETGKTVWEIAEFFTNQFYESTDKLNVLRPDVVAKATETVKEQIELIGRLIKKGYAYDTPEAVYFNVSKFKNYGAFVNQTLEDKKVAVREEVQKGEHKKHPSDFALWFKRVGRFKNHVMHWDSPWGDGFPGWHIECSAIGMKYLGEQFDIHTGGIDHLPVHHPNEIAQSEAATGKTPFVKYWIHHAFLMVDGTKMSKSLGNLYTVEDVEKKGFEALSLRYFYLGAHYHDSLNFTWEALTSAQNALTKLKNLVSTYKVEKGRTALSEEKREKTETYLARFIQAINNDLSTPTALAVLWEMLKSNIPSEDKYDLAISFDEVLGLGLTQVQTPKIEIPGEIKVLVEKRETLRKEGKFSEADEVRKEIEEKGYFLEDTPSGPKIRQK